MCEERLWVCGQLRLKKKINELEERLKKMRAHMYGVYPKK